MAKEEGSKFFPVYRKHRRGDHFESPYRRFNPQKPKRVVWISQHPMAGVQMAALRRMFGDDVEVVHWPHQFVFQDSASIVKRIRIEKFDDCIVVAPYSVLDRMCRLGLRPLWAEAEQVHSPEQADWSVKGRHYRFLGFRRVKRLVLELEDLGEAAKRQPGD